MTVKRFKPVASAAISLSENGDYVRYEDYAALEAKYAGLEARAIELPPAWWVRQGKAPEFLAYPEKLVIDAIHAAGIGVKKA
ncbi:hypothetical protein J9D08_001943 [Salmonella enterica]|nr:hypothetical protein [Salmonella enterica]